MPRASATQRANSEGLSSSPFLTDDQRAALDAALAKKKAEEGGAARGLGACVRACVFACACGNSRLQRIGGPQCA